jgi:hypothetical protein
LMMEVIHSPGATLSNQQERSGAVGNFLSFDSFGRSAHVLAWEIHINIFRPLSIQNNPLNKGLFDILGLFFTHSICRRPQILGFDLIGTIRFIPG